MKRLLSLLTLAAAFAPGCGNGPEAKDFNKAMVTAAQATCTCNGHTLLAYGSEAECLAEFPPSAGEQACVEELFKSLDPAFGPHIECRTGARQRYASCLNSKTCSDLERLGCGAQLLDEEEDCPDFPDDVQKELNECLN